MATVAQCIQALANAESGDDPEAWGDDRRALGTYQCHADRAITEARRLNLWPLLNERWDDWVGRIVLRIFTDELPRWSPVAVAMYWHLEKWLTPDMPGWDVRYASDYLSALAAVTSAV